MIYQVVVADTRQHRSNVEFGNAARDERYDVGARFVGRMLHRQLGRLAEGPTGVTVDRICPARFQ